jgi:protein-S-isoprenylcysteine O-methyltransferase Ste14
MEKAVMRLEAHLLNPWLMCLPLVLEGIYVAVFRRDVARRMADMTGYTRMERAFTIGASTTPYPFMVLTVWTPFTTVGALMVAGFVLFLVGLVALVASARVLHTTPPGEPFSTGIYRLSRHPFYVSAALVFLGICLATANVALLVILVVILVLQHFMILAEERVCREKFGSRYVEYMRRVPRYVAIR